MVHNRRRSKTNDRASRGWSRFEVFKIDGNISRFDFLQNGLNSACNPSSEIQEQLIGTGRRHITIGTSEIFQRPD